MPKPSTDSEPMPGRGVDEAIATARRAQRAWAACSIGERLRPIRAFRALIARDAGDLADAAATGRNRPRAEALAAEILPLADACAFLEREAPCVLKPQRLARRNRPRWLFGVEIELRREPLGVILIIAPSNYPLFLPGVQLVQALVAGNAALLKPAPGCSAPLLLLHRLFAEAGLPDGLIHVVGEQPDEARAAIRTGVDKVLLTGSAETGRRLLADLAPRLTPATMELSGCDAAFVLPGADIAMTAAALAYGVRLNGGATCIAPRWVFVPRAMAKPLLAELERRLDGSPGAPVGLTVAERTRRLLADARDAGCRLIGPMPAAGSDVVHPTIVVGATPELRLLDEDLFAPVLSIVLVADEGEALEQASRCRFALGASVFGDEAAARRLAALIDAGCVTVNDLIVPTADPRLPFGGRKESGFGVTRGRDGLLELTRVKAIAVRRGRFRPHVEPPRPDDAELFLAYVRAAHGASAAARFRAALDLAWRLLRRR